MKTNLLQSWTLIHSLEKHEKKQLSEYFKSDSVKTDKYYFLFKTLIDLNFFRQNTVKRLCTEAGIKNYSDLSKRFYSKLTEYFSIKDEIRKDFSFIKVLIDKKIYDVADKQIENIIDKGLDKYPLEVALNILNLRRITLYHLNINTPESNKKQDENEVLIDIYESNFKIDTNLNKQLPNIWVDFYQIELSEVTLNKIDKFFLNLEYDEDWLPPIQLKYYWFRAMYDLCLKNYDLYIENTILLLTKGTHPNVNFLLILLIIAIQFDRTLFNQKYKKRLRFENFFKASLANHKSMKQNYTSFIKYIDLTNSNKKFSVKQIDKYLKESYKVDVFVSSNKHDRIKDRFVLIRLKLLLRQGLYDKFLELIPPDLVTMGFENSINKDTHNLKLIIFYVYFMSDKHKVLLIEVKKAIKELKKVKLTNNCYYSYYTILKRAIELYAKQESKVNAKYKKAVALLIEKEFGDVDEFSFPEEMLININLVEILNSIKERKTIIELYN